MGAGRTLREEPAFQGETGQPPLLRHKDDRSLQRRDRPVSQWGSFPPFRCDPQSSVAEIRSKAVEETIHCRSFSEVKVLEFRGGVIILSPLFLSMSPSDNTPCLFPEPVTFAQGPRVGSKGSANFLRFLSPFPLKRTLESKPLRIAAQRLESNRPRGFEGRPPGLRDSALPTISGEDGLGPPAPSTDNAYPASTRHAGVDGPIPGSTDRSGIMSTLQPPLPRTVEEPE